MAKDIQYKYAIEDNSEGVVNIFSLTKEGSKGHKYYCPACHNEMYPTFGNKYEHHFRHNCDTCQRLNYLHNTAELLFLKEYKYCLENGTPFLLEIHSRIGCDRNCTACKNRLCLDFKDKTVVDLTKIYTDIKCEYRVKVDDHYRRPDILLTSKDGEQLWIEIWVTHETDTAKRQEGHIIELKIYNEKDLEQISNHELVKTVDNDLAVRLFNIEFDELGIVTKEVHTPEDCTAFRPISNRYNYSYTYRQTGKQRSKKPITPTIPVEEINPDNIEWVDLGLKSGTLWAKEDYALQVDFESAFYGYRKHVPSKTLATELYNECTREWDEETQCLRLIGPNGNYISFQVKDDHETYWLNFYEVWGDLGQCFHIFRDKRFLINDMSHEKPGRVRLVRRKSEITVVEKQLSLFDD